jgi:hypothetical protein
MEKKSNITIPQEKELEPKTRKIENTNRQYISKNLHYVKAFFEKQTLNNDIEFNKIIFS